MAEKRKPEKSEKIPPVTDLSTAARALRQPTLPVRGGEERTTLELDGEKRLLPSDAPDQLGEYLVSQGVITRHQLFNAMNESYSTGCSLREALLSLGYVDRESLQRTAPE